MANLVASYSESNKDAAQALASNTGSQYRYVGQSFLGNGENLDNCKFYLQKAGSPTGNLIAYLYATTGSNGSTATPTGSPLATSTIIDVSTISTSFGLVTFTFDDTFTMVNGTCYAIISSYTTGDASNCINVGLDSSSPTDTGNMVYNKFSFAADATKDICFYVYSVAASVGTTLSKLSLLGAG